MTTLAKTTVRNSSTLLLVRGVEAFLGFLIAFFIPRVMGPELYGQYVFLTSISLWFILASTLGFRHIIGRYVGDMELQPGNKLRIFIGNLISIRSIAALLVALAFVIMTRIWFTEYTIQTLIITGGVIFLRAISQLIYDLFLGLNQTHRWAVGDLIRRVLSLIAVYVGFTLDGLTGAMLGWLLSEMIVSALGILWTRNYLSLPGRYLKLRDMVPYLRFGFVYFISGLLQSAFQQSGGLVVRLMTGDYVQVAYFGLAFNIYLAGALVIPNLTLAFSPFLSRLYAEQNLSRIQFWMSNMVKWLAIGCMLIIAGANFLGNDIIPLILGQDYAPVVQYLLPLMIAFLGVALSESARLLTLVIENPRMALSATGVELVIFWICAVLFVHWFGGIGATYAVLLASSAGAIYLTLRVRKQLAYSIIPSILAIVFGAGLLLVSFIPFPTGLLWNALKFGIFTSAYTALLFTSRLISLNEIQEIWNAVRSINQ